MHTILWKNISSYGKINKGKEKRQGNYGKSKYFWNKYL